MRNQTTILLMILFAAALGVLWWVDYSRLPDRNLRQAMLNRVLPELIETRPADIRRIEVSSTDRQEPIVIERRKGSAWQILKPIEAAADASSVETLVTNLRELRRSPDSGLIEGDPEPYGLKTPRATIKVFTEDAKEPKATLQIGRTLENKLYVRSDGEKGIDVVDSRLLNAVDLTPVDWRDKMLFHMPSFRVASVTIEQATPNRTIKAERGERRWKLVSPIKAPAEDDQVEGLVAELSALHVADGLEGFVADNVRDLSPYGLDHPALTLTLTPADRESEPQRLLIGKSVPEKEHQVYAIVEGQDDVVRIEIKTLQAAIAGRHPLRSQRVLDLAPARVTRVLLKTKEGEYDLVKLADGGWQLLSPVNERAETAPVVALLTRLTELRTSEFLDPASVGRSGLENPTFHLRIWQATPGKSDGALVSAAPPESPPDAELLLGIRDLDRKTVYARVPGDTSILALPDEFLADLPRNLFAFRDRTILSLRPEQFKQVTVERPKISITVEAPGATGSPLHWKVIEPVKAAAEDSSVTNLLVTLGTLTAESWESATVGDGKSFGLDNPPIRIKWTLFPTTAAKADPKSTGARNGVLRIGAPKKGSASVYANIEGDPRVFTINPSKLGPLNAELHKNTVLSLKPEQIERLVFRWPTRTIACVRSTEPATTATAWKVEPGSDPTGFDVRQIQPLLAALSPLQTSRFLQYQGPISAEEGLETPRLTVEVRSFGESTPETLRIGAPFPDGSSRATTVSGDSGPVFVVATDAVWQRFLTPPAQSSELPRDVFTPPASARPDHR